MELTIICVTALFASGLTLFSGFGLGTLLMPATALFFPIEIAIAMTAIVHLANNLFKVFLLGRYAVWRVVLRFGLPAFIFAAIGALALDWLSDLSALYEYSFFNNVKQVSPIKLTVGLLILIFVWFELGPKKSGLASERRYLPFGGMISGFFGGLSGHQGAFRSMFLIKLGLSKQAFISTGVMLAVIIDVSRILFYTRDISSSYLSLDWTLIVMTCLCAFSGSFIGSRLIDKITLKTIQIVVTVMLIAVAVGLIIGLV